MYILYFCVLVLAGYIFYIRKYLLKVVVILDAQKKFYMNKVTQTLYHEGSSTEVYSDVPEVFINLDQEGKDLCAASTPEERYFQRKKRYYKRRKRWQKENFYQ